MGHSQSRSLDEIKVHPQLSSARRALALFVLLAIGAVAFTLGLVWSSIGHAEERARAAQPGGKVIYPKKTELDFEGIQVEGELRNPGEFYFQHRDPDKFDSLVKRRKNFHREMLRDAVLGK